MNRYLAATLVTCIVFGVLFMILWNRGGDEQKNKPGPGPSSGPGRQQNPSANPSKGPGTPQPAVPLPNPQPAAQPVPAGGAQGTPPGPAAVPAADPAPAGSSGKSPKAHTSLFDPKDTRPVPENAAGPQESGQQNPGYFTYTVESTSSLYKIAAETLGDGEKWREILSLNGDLIRDTERVPRGTVLKIPGERKRLLKFEDPEPEKKDDSQKKLSDWID